MPEKKEITKSSEPRGWDFWDPFPEMRGLQRAFSHAFGDFFDGNRMKNWGLDLEGGRVNGFPAVSIEEKDKEYVLMVDVPGMGKDDVHVELDNSLLKIRGERKFEKEEKEKNYLRKEQFYGSFNRSFSLPSDAKSDEVKADYKNGVLTIHVARKEDAKAKNIEIKVQ